MFGFLNTKSEKMEANIKELMLFGFVRDQVVSALSKCNNNKELAADLLFRSTPDRMKEDA